MNITPSQNFNFNVNVGYSRNHVRMPLSNNSSNSILRNGMRGRADATYQYEVGYRNFGPTLATDRAGNWVAAWSTYDQTSDIFVSTSADGGVTWSMPAGLRVLVFAKQKMSSEVDLFIVGAHDAVKETITMTGFHYSCIMLDSYDAEVIEA